VTGWHGGQWDFENNEKIMQHFDQWIVTGWHGEQWDFQNNEKTMKHYHCIVTRRNGEIFEAMKRKWKIQSLVTGWNYCHAKNYVMQSANWWMAYKPVLSGQTCLTRRSSSMRETHLRSITTEL
jgi:hypothetical protein